MAQTSLKDNLAAPFTGSEICEIARITPRQLQWWVERGLVASVRSRYRRSFEPQEALAVLIIGDLRQKGFSLEKIRRVLRVFRREAGPSEGGLPADRSQWFLVTDGKSVNLESDQESIIETFKNSRRAMVLVPVSDLLKRVRGFERKRHRKKHPETDENQLGLFQ